MPKFFIRYYKTIVVIAVLILAGWAGYYFINYSNLLDGSGASISPKKFERQWLSRPFEELRLKQDLNDELVNPQIMKVRSGKIYVADYSEMVLKKFSLNGEYLGKIGKGRGRGPGEISIS